MKTLKTLLALAALSFVFAGFVRADETKPAPEGKKAACCARAEGEQKDCAHSCCVEAGKQGKNCEKCGGTNEKKS
jgi:hypothetical protein